MVGDFVLVRSRKNGGHKLRYTWQGPRRVTGVISDLVYEVENILSKKRETVHARRLQLYRTDMDGKEVVPELLKAAEHLEGQYQTAHALHDIRARTDTNDLEFHVEWAGLPDEMDFTWEPAVQIFEDLPGMTEDFLYTSSKRHLKRRPLNQFNLSSTT